MLHVVASIVSYHVIYTVHTVCNTLLSWLSLRLTLFWNAF